MLRDVLRDRSFSNEERSFFFCFLFFAAVWYLMCGWEEENCYAVVTTD